MSNVIESLAKHLQKRVNAVEPEISELRRENEQLKARVKDLEDMGRPFAEAHRATTSLTGQVVPPASAFARAAELIPPEPAK